MSQRRIKVSDVKKAMGELAEEKDGAGPLDWIRTDDHSLFQFLYIALLTRGFYPVMERLIEACSFEAGASRFQKAELESSWIENAEFCEAAVAELGEVLESLHEKWDRAEENQQPPTSQRKQPTVGGMYPLPMLENSPLPLLYVPKKRGAGK